MFLWSGGINIIYDFYHLYQGIVHLYPLKNQFLLTPRRWGTEEIHFECHRIS
jgi:hypothetical protein